MKSNNAIGKRLLDQVRTEKASFDAVVADMYKLAGIFFLVL